MRLSIILIILITSKFLSAQNGDSIFYDRNIKELGLYAGYNFHLDINDLGTSQHKNIHTFELGIKYNYQLSPFEPYCKSFYLGSELSLVDNKVLFGPKIGYYLSAMLITVGLETVYYTDFEGHSIKIAPYFGLGSNRARMSLDFPINTYKKNFDYIDPIAFNIIFQYAILWKKTRRDYKYF